MSRMKIAEKGAASAGKDLVDRTATFWFFYNWDTRRKVIYENDDPNIPKADANGEWDRLYLIQANLPAPTILDQRVVIELPAESRSRKGDSFVAGRPIAYQLGREIFHKLGSIVPDISSDNPLHARWENPPLVADGLTVYPDRGSITIETHGKCFRVTVEEIEFDEQDDNISIPNRAPTGHASVPEASPSDGGGSASP